MKFIVDWQPNSGVREKLIERFRTVGQQLPDGVKLLGRWTRADLSGGYALIEADDPERLSVFANQWIDLMQLTIVPVVEDAALNKVFTEYDELMSL